MTQNMDQDMNASFVVAVEPINGVVKPGAHTPRSPETGLASGQLPRSWPHSTGIGNTAALRLNDLNFTVSVLDRDAAVTAHRRDQESRGRAGVTEPSSDRD
jgi:hypothetical protein